MTYDVSLTSVSDVKNSKQTYISTNIPAGDYANPGALAFDSAGNLYAGNSSYSNSFINKYDAKGVFQLTMGSSSNLLGVDSIAIDSSGKVFASQVWDGPISTYNSVSGAYLGYSLYGDRIAIDASNNIFTTTGQAVLKYDSLGNLTSTFNVNGGALALDQFGNIYVAYGNSITKLNSSGQVLNTFGDSSNLSSPQYIAIDRSGNIYAKGNGNYMSKFDSAGNLQFMVDINAWTSGGMAFAPFIVPEPSTYALAVIASGVLAVAARRRRGRKV